MCFFVYSLSLSCTFIREKYFLTNAGITHFFPAYICRKSDSGKFHTRVRFPTHQGTSESTALQKELQGKSLPQDTVPSQGRDLLY